MVKECKRDFVRRSKRKKGFNTGGSSLLKKTAIQEAQRCLSLMECESCEICSLFCPDLCITRDDRTGELQIDLDYCKGCGICAVVCPKGAIRMELEGGI
ncbi:MAG: 4Fe-4S binding protein [Thermodesulfobacteriota bacterium]